MTLATPTCRSTPTGARGRERPHRPHRPDRPRHRGRQRHRRRHRAGPRRAPAPRCTPPTATRPGSAQLAGVELRSTRSWPTSPTSTPWPTLPTDVDILVNNAGIQHVSPIEEFPLERFDLILDLMLAAPFRLIRQSLPHMYAQGWGRVVNVSSVHGLRASAFKSAYVTAKHGLEGLSKVVALEGAPHGVTRTCINPAYVRTPLVEKQIADQARTHGIPEAEVVEKVMLEPVAVKRLVEPDEVAALALFLCGPASASVTGTSFVMDGGWTAH